MSKKKSKPIGQDNLAYFFLGHSVYDSFKQLDGQ